MIRKILFAIAALLGLLSPALALEIGEPYEEKGTLLDLPDGTRLQLFVEDNTISAYFIDAEGLILEPPAESILIVNDDPLSKNQKWRTVLNPDAARMTSPRKLYPPYEFRGMVIIRFSAADPISFHKVALELASNE